MSDYISKAEAIDKIHWGINDEAFFGEPEIDQAVMKFLREFPSADVRENIHGEWITQYEIIRNPYSEEHNPHTKCSECNFRVDTHSSQFMNFCPNCGADMRGDKK